MNKHATADRWLMPALMALVGLALFLTPSSPAEAREWDSDEHNVILVIPDDPGGWSWLPDSADWKKKGIVKGATRVLDTLKSGAKATCEGGLLHLYELPLEEGKTLKDLEGDKKIRDMLLKRFSGGEKDPTVDVEHTTLNDDLPAFVLSAEGEARNKLGKMSKALGRMLVTAARGKMYALRMYVWITEYDDEGLKYDLDQMEVNFMIKQTTEKEKPPERPKEADENPDGDEPEQVEEEIQLREHHLRLTKHKKLNRKEVTDDTMLLFLEDSDRGGWYQVILYATKNGRIINGQQAPDEDIKDWITKQWWKNFTANHPDGELWTFRWPRKIKAPTFITLPDISEDARKLVAKEKKRAIDPKASDIIKKMKISEKVKKKKMGAKFKVMEPWRGIIQGNRPRYGDETVLRFGWRTLHFSFRLIVTVGGQGNAKWGDAIRQTIESMHHYK